MGRNPRVSPPALYFAPSSSHTAASDDKASLSPSQRPWHGLAHLDRGASLTKREVALRCGGMAVARQHGGGAIGWVLGEHAGEVAGCRWQQRLLWPTGGRGQGRLGAQVAISTWVVGQWGCQRDGGGSRQWRPGRLASFRRARAPLDGWCELSLWACGLHEDGGAWLVVLEIEALWGSGGDNDQRDRGYLGGWTADCLDAPCPYIEGPDPMGRRPMPPPVVFVGSCRVAQSLRVNNSFAGAIPSLCAICPALAVLDVSLNAFGGPVPPGFGNCSRLRVLSAGRNNLTGELPDDLFDVTSLEQLALPSNRIQGRLDRLRIAKLINLVKLDLTYNALTGGLPESIGDLTMLEELRLGRNNLTGTIPPVIGNWTSLRYLDLRSNNFVGDLGAVDFSRLTDLTVLDLASNNLTGAMPPSIYSCTSMTALRVANNEISGQVPPEIGDMRELQFLSLTVNNFTNISGMFWNLQGCKDLATLLVSYNFYGEALPDAGWVGDHVSNVRLIVMEECGLTGQIPSWLSKLQGLNVLNLAGNRLTGPIPSWLGAMNRLYYVDLSGNQFAGEIPPSLMELPLLASEKAMAEFNPGPLPLVFTLTPNNGAAVRTGRAYYQMSGVSATLNLSDNSFSGAIPREVGQMKTLQVLDLSYNNLSGGIPPELSGVTQIEILDLRQNRLTGSIPPALTKLHFLSDFNVEHSYIGLPQKWMGHCSLFDKEIPGLCIH
uniref:Tyrosine-sulfated glycopeptide receptor 1 n=1 Tax=Aegilops tauschii TaxID=37682 RepID=M8AWU1_AEGTA